MACCAACVFCVFMLRGVPVLLCKQDHPQRPHPGRVVPARIFSACILRTMPPSPQAQRRAGTPRKETPRKEEKETTPRKAVQPRARRGSITGKGIDEKLRRKEDEEQRRKEAIQRAKDMAEERQMLSDKLRSAAAEGAIDVVSTLCSDANVDLLNLGNDEGTTALMKGAMYGHAEVVRLLLESGASPDVVDAHGRTATMLAAANGEVAALELLLNTDVSIEDCSSNEFTVLSWAAANGRLAAIDILFASREEEAVRLLHARDSQGRRPLDIAAECDQKKALKRLEVAEASHDPPIIDEKAVVVAHQTEEDMCQIDAGGGMTEPLAADAKETCQEPAAKATVATSPGSDCADISQPDDNEHSAQVSPHEEAAEAPVTDAACETLSAFGQAAVRPSARRRLEVDSARAAGAGVDEQEQQEIAELKVLLGRE